MKKFWKNALKALGCIGCSVATVAMIAALLLALLIYDSCIEKSVDREDVAFQNQWDVEHLLDVGCLPGMSFDEATEFKGVTTVRMKFGHRLDSVEYHQILDTLNAAYPLQMVGSEVFLLRDGIFTNVYIDEVRLCIDYGKSKTDYPRQYFADSLGIILPAATPLTYDYEWPYNSHSTLYHFDKPQRRELLDTLGIDYPYYEWLHPNADGTLWGSCRFTWR